MKFLLKSLPLLIISFAFFQGCDKTDNPASASTQQTSNGFSFVINGGEYKNKTVTITSPASDSIGAVYFTNKDTTAIVLSGKIDTTTFNLVLTFKGKQAKTIAMDSTVFESDPVVLLESPTVFALYVGINGTTNVDTYGSVGEFVSGRFSGTFTGVRFSTTGLDTVRATISNGIFSARRLADRLK